MLLTKIWERYFFKEILKTALLFIGCFYGLYILIDYAHHASHFRGEHGHFDWKLFCIYYGCDLVNKSELLVPLAILLGTIKVLCKLNEDNELIAMMASGVKMNTLLGPFILVGLLGTGLMYLNNQTLLPLAAKELQYINDSHSHAKQKNNSQLAAQHLALKDQSTLLFQSYDSSRAVFFDAYWIRSSDELYRIKELEIATATPTGFSVDTFKRSPEGALLNVDYAPQMSFPHIVFDKKRLHDTLTQPEALSLTELWKKLPAGQRVKSEKQARLVSTFHHKITTPWLCLLAVVAPAPFCMRFSRRFPIFLVYACGLFGFMAMYIAMDAAHVLGRRQFVDPLLAIWLPFLFFTALSTIKYARR